MKWNKNKDSIYLACGHGTQLNGVWDCGTHYKTYTEAELMLPITKAAVALLRKSGVKVYTDADTNNNKNMTATVNDANEKKVTLYASIHCDCPGAEGIMFYYGSTEGKAFGDAIAKYCASIMGLRNKGGVKDLAKFEVHVPNMPSIIYESGGIQNNLKTLKDNPKKYGRAIAKAICKYIGVPVYVSTRTKIKRKTAEILAYMNKHNFKYNKSYKACGTSWKQAKKTKRSNCATMICYALQELGLLKPGQIFWINSTAIKCVGSGTKARIKKTFTIKHPKKSPKTAGLKAGYIVGYKDNPHTQEFVKWNKNKKPLWYSWGPSDVGKKQPRHKKSYDNKKIMTMLVPK